MFNRLDMSKLAAEMGLEGRFFLTREKGEVAYQGIKTHLQLIPSDQALVLSFPPNQIMDVSFADEALIRLGQEILAGDLGQRCIVLAGLTEDSIRNVEAAIRLQRLKLAFLCVMPEGSWKCIGALESTLRDTLDLVAQRGRLTAPELSEFLGLAMNTASNRLKRLFDLHLLRREYEITDRGLQYIYYFWKWVAQADSAAIDLPKQ